MCNDDVVHVDGQPNYVARFGIVFAKQAWISGIVFKSHPINEMCSQSFLPGGMVQGMCCWTLTLSTLLSWSYIVFAVERRVRHVDSVGFPESCVALNPDEVVLST